MRSDSELSRFKSPNRRSASARNPAIAGIQIQKAPVTVHGLVGIDVSRRVGAHVDVAAP